MPIERILGKSLYEIKPTYCIFGKYCSSVSSVVRTTHLIVFLFVLFQFHSATGQSRFSENLKVMVNYHYGFGLPEYSALSYILNDYTRGIDVALIKERYGSNEFERLYKYPENGVAFFYTSLGNKEILGNAFGINYLFRLNIVQHKRFRLINRMGIGLAYITKKHHFNDDPLNVVIGSHVNIHYNCRFGATYRLLDRFEINAGASFDHFSNGNTAEPNIGLNYLTFYGGGLYMIGNAIERNTSPISKPERNLYWEIFANIGAKHTRSFSSKYFPTGSFGGELGFAWFRGFHVGVGVDLFYDSSIRTQLEALDRSYSGTDSFQSGIHISQSVVYRRFRFTLQEGFYLGFKEPINHGLMYNRAILKYSLSDIWSLRLAMKSHLHILDYPEIGVSYKFK